MDRFVSYAGAVLHVAILTAQRLACLSARRVMGVHPENSLLYSCRRHAPNEQMCESVAKYLLLHDERSPVPVTLTEKHALT